MNRIRCLVIDDEQAAVDHLVDFISMVPDLLLVGKFTEPQLALQFIFEEEVDLIFLDGNMPKMNGIDLVKSLSKPPQIIFCTGSDVFAFATYEIRVTDCLKKPISYARFSRALHYVRQALNPSYLILPGKVDQEEDYRYFSSAGRNTFQKILYSEIEYAEINGNYVDIHNVWGKVTARCTLKQLEERLPGDAFMRVHKGFIIANKMIKKVAGHKIYLNDKVRIPVGERYRETLYEFIKERM